MEHTFIVYFFILGLVLGSFFNVVGLRVPKGELFTQKRSYCPKCLHKLTWLELLPLFSYLLLNGRCRYCKQSIPKMYPVMELVSALSFTCSYYIVGFQVELILALLLMSLFHIIIVSDLTYMIIPDKVLLFFLFPIVIYRIVIPLTPWWSSLLGAFVGVVGTGLIIIVSRGGMGGGDMKLFGLIGLSVGTNLLLLSFFLATVLATIVSVGLLLTRVMSKKNPIPFGPFIVAGTTIAFYFGTLIIDWYVMRFFY